MIEAVSGVLFSYNLRFKVSNEGNVTADGSFSGGGADFAEMEPADDPVEPADVLIIGADGKLKRSDAARDSRVAGIYSTKPGFVGGSGADVDDGGKIPVAVVGIVPVKVVNENGPIDPGNLLVSSSIPGHAMKADANPALGTIVGKALAHFDGDDGVISMLVVLQ